MTIVNVNRVKFAWELEPEFVAPADAELASHVVERDIDWLVEGRIPSGMVTLIAGRPGGGKSLVTAWLAAQVSKAGGPVIFSNLEDLRAQTSKPRLRIAGANLDLIHFWTPKLTTPEGIALLEAFVVAMKTHCRGSIVSLRP